MRVLRPPIELEVLTEEPGGREPPSTHLDSTALDSTALDSTFSLKRQQGLYRRCPSSHRRPVELSSTTNDESDKKMRIGGRVRVASGPWELEEQWWSKERTERDYWDIELDDGGLYRIYRERLSERWYADGVYD